MSTVLLAAALAATLASPTTGGLPDRRNGINVQVWQVYTQELLEKIFPEERDRLATVQFFFFEDDEPNAFASFELNAFRVNTGLVHLVRDEAEYAFVIAHEVQHILNRHRPSLKAAGWFGVEVDFAQLRRKEITADILAIDALRRAGIDVCGDARVTARLLRHFRSYENPEDQNNRLGLHRKRIADYYCRQSKAAEHIVPQEP